MSLGEQPIEQRRAQFPTCNNPVGLGAKRTTGARIDLGADLWRRPLRVKRLASVRLKAPERLEEQKDAHRDIEYQADWPA